MLPLARSPVVSLLAVAAALTACGSDQTSAGTRTVSVGNGTVRADVADSTGERDKGLSGRASLSLDELYPWLKSRPQLTDTLVQVNAITAVSYTHLTLPTNREV